MMRSLHIEKVLCIVAISFLAGCRNNSSPMAEPPAETYRIQPTAAVLTVGHGTAFAAKRNGRAALDVAWRVLEPGGGTVDGTGQYQAPAIPGVYTVQAEFKYSAGRTATALVTVVPRPAGEITAPHEVKPEAGGMVASIVPVPGSHYVWTITGGKLTGGSDSPAVSFQAGAGPKLVLNCRVTNAAGDSLDSSQEVAFVHGVSLTISPAAVTITEERTMKFGFNIGGGTTLGVAWSLGKPGSGSIDGQGNYLAPTVPGLYSVRVTSLDDPTESVTARVKVVPKPPEGLFAPDSYKPGALDLHARVPQVDGMTYAWQIEGGTISMGSTASSMMFHAGHDPSITLRCRITNEAGDSSTTKKTLRAE
jgi:hypothetical protein